MERTEEEIMQSWKGDRTLPLVSICTITYNHGKYISEALDSFLAQQTNCNYSDPLTIGSLGTATPTR